MATIIFADPPDPPTILGYEPGSHLRAGERVSLSCVSQGGNPPATLTWYRADTELTSSTEVQDSVARSVVTFQVDHTDNGRTYTCRSTNSKLSKVQSANVELSVYCELAQIETGHVNLFGEMVIMMLQSQTYILYISR